MSVDYTISPRERDVQLEIVRKLRGSGWMVISLSDFRYSNNPGLFDFLALRDGKTLAVECKRTDWKEPGPDTKAGKKRALQIQMAQDCARAGGWIDILARSWADVEKVLVDRGIW